MGAAASMPLVFLTISADVVYVALLFPLCLLVYLGFLYNPCRCAHQLCLWYKHLQHQYLCNHTTAEIPLALSASECLNCQKVQLLREYSVKYNLVSTAHFFDVSLSTDLSDHDSSLIGLVRLCVISIKH